MSNSRALVVSHKTPYILKRDRLEPTLQRLQDFWDAQLSIEGEVYRALQQEIDQHGKHGTATADVRPTED